MISLLLQMASAAPDACLATGLCGLVQPIRPVAPGLMFVAVGLVAGGAWGLWRRPNRRAAAPGPLAE